MTDVSRAARVAVVVVVGGALALWLALRSSPDAAGPGAREPAAAAHGSAVPAAVEPGRQPAPPLGHPEPPRFTEEVREFFASAAALPEAERERRAAALRERIAEREREGTLLPPEALLLRLALLRVSVEDPAVLDHEIRSLTESAREEQAARPPAPPDPRFELYKRRETEVVREVLALDRIPGDLPRDEYLRRRLRELRSEIYSGTGADPEAR